MKTNAQQLTGGLLAVFWGLPGPRAPQPQWVPWLEPRKGSVGLPFCCLGVGQPCSLAFLHKGSPQAALDRPGLLSKPLTVSVSSETWRENI